MIRWLLPAALLALTGCGKTDSLDGFKDISFGLDQLKVEALGFTCQADGDCRAAESNAQAASSSPGSADVALGERVFVQCAACHTINRDGANGIGPNLYGVVGEAVAQGRAGFAFSDALKAKGGRWDFATLDAWIAHPRDFAPGTKMTFAGVSDPQQRSDVIAYLNSQGSNLPLPTAKVTSGPAATPPKVPAYTLFGKEARVTPTLKSGTVVSIDVTVALGQKETIDLLQGEYGDAKSYDYDNISGGRTRVSYWLFGNGASISLTETLTEGELGVSAMMRREGLGVGDYLSSHTTVQYLDKGETDALLKRAKGNTVDPHDT